MEHGLTSVLLRSVSPEFKSVQCPIWFTLCSPTFEVSIPSTVGTGGLFYDCFGFVQTAYKSIRENTVIVSGLYLSAQCLSHRNVIHSGFFENC